MGISGLHKELKPYIKPSHVSNYAAKRVGIDAFAWLHRGACQCALQLATGEAPWRKTNPPEDAPWVRFCLKMLTMLRGYNCIPVVVFDGCRLPAKNVTSEKRKTRKEKALADAHTLLAQGDTDGASKKFMQTVDITPEMAQELIIKLRELDIEYIVAPYEADAQLAYLCSLDPWEGGIEAVITEDSDMVAYGCEKVLFKCTDQGEVEELSSGIMYAGADTLEQNTTTTTTTTTTTATQQQQQPFTTVPHTNNNKPTTSGTSSQNNNKKQTTTRAKVVCYKGWSVELVRAACVLAGCDFLPSVHGVQYKTAHGIVAPFASKTTNSSGGGGSSMVSVLDGPLNAMKTHKRWSQVTTDEYISSARLAFLTFCHTIVYDPNTKSCVRVLPLPPNLTLTPEESTHVGGVLNDDVMHGIALGKINPLTFDQYGEESVGEFYRGLVRNFEMQREKYLQQYQSFIPLQVPSGGSVVAARPPLPPPPSQQQQQQQQQFNYGNNSTVGNGGRAAGVTTAANGIQQQQNNPQQQQQQNQQGQRTYLAAASRPQAQLGDLMAMYTYGNRDGGGNTTNTNNAVPSQQQQQQQQTTGGGNNNHNTTSSNPFARRLSTTPNNNNPATQQVQQMSQHAAALFRSKPPPSSLATALSNVQYTVASSVLATQPTLTSTTIGTAGYTVSSGTGVYSVISGNGGGGEREVSSPPKPQPAVAATNYNNYNNNTSGGKGTFVEERNGTILVVNPSANRARNNYNTTITANDGSNNNNNRGRQSSGGGSGGGSQQWQQRQTGSQTGGTKNTTTNNSGGVNVNDNKKKRQRDAKKEDKLAPEKSRISHFFKKGV